jgi:hypothetical protein
MILRTNRTHPNVFSMRMICFVFGRSLNLYPFMTFLSIQSPPILYIYYTAKHGINKVTKGNNGDFNKFNFNQIL